MAVCINLDSNCDRHFTGPRCEWPICVHGTLDPVRRICWCHNYFAPPFCEFCLPGFWGEACDREIHPATREPLQPPFLTHVIVYVIVVIMSISIYFACNRHRRNSKTYQEVKEDAPPPYSVV